MAPHTTTRACRANCVRAMSSMSPPTLSKYTLTPVGQCVRRVLRTSSLLLVDRRIEPEFIDDVAALRGAAGDPDRATTFDLGDLADRCADRAGGGGDNDGVALFGVAHIQQAEIGGHAGHAERIEEGWQRCEPGIDLGKLRAIERGVFLHAETAAHVIVCGELRVF